MNKDSCVVLSIPRAGTHIIMKLLLNLGYIELDAADYKRKWNEPIPKTNHFIYGAHAHASDDIDKFEKTGVKGIYIMRDLKDLVTSLSLMYKKQGNFKDKEDLIKSLIIGDNNFKPLKQRFECDYGWMNHPNIHVTAFELFNKQPEIEIEKICKFLNCKNITKANELWGYKKDHIYFNNFRKGIIGDWKNHFEEHHIELFDEHCKEVNKKIHKFIKENTNER